MEPGRGESYPSGQRRGPAAPGEDRVLSPDQKSFHISMTNSNNLGTKTGIPRVDMLRQRVGPAQLYFYGTSYDSPAALGVRIQYPAAPLVPPIDPKFQSREHVR